MSPQIQFHVFVLQVSSYSQAINDPEIVLIVLIKSTLIFSMYLFYFNVILLLSTKAFSEVVKLGGGGGGRGIPRRGSMLCTFLRNAHLFSIK